MRKKRTRTPWPSIFRKLIALFLASAALFLLWLTADFASIGKALEGLLNNADLARALLTAELGGQEPSALTGIDRLAVAQSALLQVSMDAVIQEMELHEESEGPKETVPTQLFPSPAPTPTVSPDPEVLTTTAPDDIIPRTMVPGSSTRYVSEDGIYIYNYTDYGLDISRLLKDSPDWELSRSEGPQILIYHSHTTEAYTMDGTDIYEESDSSRTTDPRFNMIRIGEEMKEVFEAAGLSVIHDDTLYDFPIYSGAYDRSAQGISAILEEYPTIKLVLDVHRDALEGADGSVYKTAAGTVADCAQLMLVVGSNAGGQQHDGWRENLSLAVGIQKRLLDSHGTLIRPTVLRSSRFNQQMSPGAILVEVGSHGNTLQEAITAARLFAEEVAALLG